MDMLADAKEHLKQAYREYNANPSDLELQKAVKFWTAQVLALEQSHVIIPDPDTPFNPQGGGPPIVPFDPNVRPVNPMAVVGGGLVILFTLALLLRK